MSKKDIKSTRHKEISKMLTSFTEQQKTLIGKLIDDVVFMEARMEELKQLPFIRVHPKNPARQAATPAAKQYKDLSQAYMNALKILLKLTDTDNENDDSDLRKYLSGLMK